MSPSRGPRTARVVVYRVTSDTRVVADKKSLIIQLGPKMWHRTENVAKAMYPLDEGEHYEFEREDGEPLDP